MLIATIAIILSLFTIQLEEGATFDDGICWEADGTEGISAFDGQCVTPADYDAIFSYENLDSIEMTQPQYEGVSIAEAYGIQPEPAASDRPIGVGVSDDNRTFKQRVKAAHMPIAD